MQSQKSNRQCRFLCPDLIDQRDPRNHLLGLAKASLTKTSGIIVGALSFSANPHVGHTPSAALNQVGSIVRNRRTLAICDRRYCGKRGVGTSRNEISESAKSAKTEHKKRQARVRFRRKAAIELINGHLKNDHRMLRNYPKGRIGNFVNLFIACAAFNFGKFIQILCFLCLKLLEHVFGRNVRPLQACA